MYRPCAGAPARRNQNSDLAVMVTLRDWLNPESVLTSMTCRPGLTAFTRQVTGTGRYLLSSPGRDGGTGWARVPSINSRPAGNFRVATFAFGSATRATT